MIYSESSLARRIFTEFLPPWASRVGYADGVPAPETLVPPHIFPIPLSVAPAATLDGIWVDSAHAPRTVPDLASTLASLGPGGVAVLFLPARFWKRRDLRKFCLSAGARILFFSPVPAKGQIKLNRRGLPVPKSILRRFLLRMATMFFPGLSFLAGSEWFIILQKSIGRSRETDGARLSIIIPLAENREQARRRLHEWEEFLSRHRMYDVQLVAIDESEGDPLEGMAGSTVRVHHYRNFGRSHAIRSGLFNAKGKAILIDSDRQLSPAFLFDLLQERFREPREADVLSGYDESRQPPFWSRWLSRWISGLSRPDPLYLLISEKAARAILDLHPEQMRGYRYAIPLHLRRAGLKVREIPLHPDPPVPMRSETPSLLEYLRYRLHRGAVYLLILLWFPFIPQMAEHLHEAFDSRVRPEVLRGKQSLLSAIPVDRERLLAKARSEFPASARVFFSLAETVTEAAGVTGNEIRKHEDGLQGFFFVLLIATVLHFYNSVVVFHISAGTILAFLLALVEAALFHTTRQILEGQPGSTGGLLPGDLLPGGLLHGDFFRGLLQTPASFSVQNPIQMALPLFVALFFSRAICYPFHLLVFRRTRKARSPI